MANPINIQSILDVMKSTLLLYVNSNKAEVIAEATQYFDEGKTRLSELADGLLSGQLSYAFGVKRFKEEGTNIVDQLLSIEQLIAGDVQEIANKVVDIFRNAIDNAIGQLQQG